MEPNVIPLTETIVKGSSYWLFYRKVLRMLEYKPYKQVGKFYKDDRDRLHMRLQYIFKHHKRGKFILFISKELPLYFVEKKPDGTKYVSKKCNTIFELEKEFLSYFKRSKAFLPRKVILNSISF